MSQHRSHISWARQSSTGHMGVTMVDFRTKMHGHWPNPICLHVLTAPLLQCFLLHILYISPHICLGACMRISLQALYRRKIALTMTNGQLITRYALKGNMIVTSTTKCNSSRDAEIGLSKLVSVIRILYLPLNDCTLQLPPNLTTKWIGSLQLYWDTT